MVHILINNNNNNNNSTFKWYKNNNIYVKGYGYDNGRYKEGKELINYFTNIKKEEEFKNILQKLGGFISVIVVNDNVVFATADRFGAFDLFYSKVENDIYISDKVKDIIKETGQKSINLNGKKDYIYTGYICHGETLIKNIYSISKFKYLLYNGKVQLKQYYQIKYEPKNYQNYHEIKKQFDEVVHKVGKKLVDSLDNKQVFIPLSGGMDSRFILLLLIKMNYKNITCFAYGSRIFSERNISKRVAQANNIKFIDIPYKRKEWKNLFSKKENIKYFLSESNYNNMVHLMDYFAAKNIHVENGVIIPGHYGAIAKNAYLNSFSKKEAMDLFINKYMFFYDKKTYKINSYLKERVSSYFDDFYDNDNIYRQAEIFDYAAYDTYRPNHIIKALKPYENKNIQWRLPLLDDDFIEFMNKIPIEYRINKRFLGRYILESLKPDIRYYKPSKILIFKILKNIFDRRYACISLKDILQFKFDDVYLPKGIKLVYRMYRNFLSYIAIKNYLIIERDLHEK